MGDILDRLDEAIRDSEPVEGLTTERRFYEVYVDSKAEIERLTAEQVEAVGAIRYCQKYAAGEGDEGLLLARINKKCVLMLRALAAPTPAKGDGGEVPKEAG